MKILIIILILIGSLLSFNSCKKADDVTNNISFFYNGEKYSYQGGYHYAGYEGKGSVICIENKNSNIINMTIDIPERYVYDQNFDFALNHYSSKYDKFSCVLYADGNYISEDSCEFIIVSLSDIRLIGMFSLYNNGIQVVNGTLDVPLKY